MEAEICKYFKYGYCKYTNHCRMHHLKETCEIGSTCKSSKVCMKRHPKVCKSLSVEGFCRHGDKCAYRHTNQNTIHNQNERDMLNVKVESLEKIVQEMAKTISVLQNELYDQRDNRKYDLKADCVNDINSQENLDCSILGQQSEDNITEIEKGQLKCEHCDYRCKKVITLKKHIKTKHTEKILTCNHCEGKFTSSSYLNVHIADKHCVVSEVVPEENQHNVSFVFSESMLDEFMDPNIQLQV